MQYFNPNPRDEKREYNTCEDLHLRKKLHSHIQLVGTNVRLRKTHRISPEVDFESSRSTAKSESWNSPEMLCRISHMTVLYVVTRVVNVGRQTSQAFVICSPTVERLVYQCVPSTSISGRFESRRSTILSPFPIPFFALIVVKTWCGDFTQLLNCFLPIRGAVPRISSHVLPSRRTTK